MITHESAFNYDLRTITPIENFSGMEVREDSLAGGPGSFMANFPKFFAKMIKLEFLSQFSIVSKHVENFC